jgi:hypothetical protein
MRLGGVLHFLWKEETALQGAYLIANLAPEIRLSQAENSGRERVQFPLRHEGVGYRNEKTRAKLHEDGGPKVTKTGVSVN